MLVQDAQHIQQRLLLLQQRRTANAVEADTFCNSLSVICAAVFVNNGGASEQWPVSARDAACSAAAVPTVLVLE
jgi:hypothetical protein